MPIVPTERYRKITTSSPQGYGRYTTGVYVAGSFGIHNMKHMGVTDWRRPKSDKKVYPFDMLYYEEIGGRLNKDGTQGNHAVFQNYMPVVYTWDNFPHHVTLPGNPSDTVAATRAAARTNPSRPYVDVPVFVLELGDIASLLVKQLFKTRLGEIAELNIAYQFGIAPMVDDLSKLVAFAHQFYKRMEEIKRLESDKGLRRTVDIGVYSNSGVYEKILQSQGVFEKGNFSARTKVTVRAHCRWVPTPGYKKLAASDVEWRLKKIMHGLTVDSSTVWEALPFSWFIDYCTSIGDYFKANRNMVDVRLDSVHVMRHSETYYTFAGKNREDISFAGSQVIRISKTRVKASVAPVAHLPFLSANQLGILGSVAAVMSKRF